MQIVYQVQVPETPSFQRERVDSKKGLPCGGQVAQMVVAVEDKMLKQKMPWLLRTTGLQNTISYLYCLFHLFSTWIFYEFLPSKFNKTNISPWWTSLRCCTASQAAEVGCEHRLAAAEAHSHGATGDVAHHQTGVDDGHLKMGGQGDRVTCHKLVDRDEPIG